MNPEFEKIFEDLGWNVTVYEDDVELRKTSPAGENFSISISSDSLPDSVRGAAENFDIDDHVYMMLDAKRSGLSGVPDVRTLVDDAEAIQEMLDELADALERADSNP